MQEYLAHIAEDGRKQTVDEHLAGTAKRAAEFAKEFDAEPFGNFAGLSHDIGKYTDGFQRRLYGGPKIDHSSAGAIECVKKNITLTGCCVIGHHGGLPDYGNVQMDAIGEQTYVGRIRKGLLCNTKSKIAWKGSLPEVPPEPVFDHDRFTQALWCRMLYSCLVDADYLDTEAFMSHNQVARGGNDSIETLAERLNEFVAQWKNPSTALNKIRCGVLQACMDSSVSKKGLFSLTVPTGGGKTTASLAFALHHALHHGMKRIIYVIPYTSIIEQNAAVFRKIVGEENVVEHHSEVQMFEEQDISSPNISKALATENWDAPIIVTTAVQFYESLYSNKPSKCRKLHNIANSVIILDEAQMIPTAHLRPCVAVIAKLVAHFGASAVLCTATQPFLADLFAEYAPTLRVKEIADHVENTFEALTRVTYQNAGKLTMDQLADRLAEEAQVLCIVNTRKKAQELFHLLPKEESFHLSTLMYPEHRQATLETVRKRLQEGKPCRVVSTSLIEAGVDVDFPSVYRELAGLDSIVQAAGRCNREGRRSASDSIVTIFESDASAPSLLKVNIGAAREALAVYEDIGSPQSIERYFIAYRSLMGTNIDKSNAVKHLRDGIAGCDLPFRTVAENFHLIDNNTKTIYIVCEGSQGLIEAIINGEADRKIYRRAGRYSVQAYEKHYDQLIRAGAIIEIDTNSAYLVNQELYSTETGLSLNAEIGRAFFI